MAPWLVVNSTRAAGPPDAGRPLVDVLQDLNRRGLRIVFSTSLVRPSLRVAGEPAGPTPREVLDQVLRPHGLRARPVRRARWSWPAPRARERTACLRRWPAARSAARSWTPTPSAAPRRARGAAASRTPGDDRCGRAIRDWRRRTRQAVAVRLAGRLYAGATRRRRARRRRGRHPGAARSRRRRVHGTAHRARRGRGDPVGDTHAIRHRSTELQELRTVLADDPFRACRRCPTPPPATITAPSSRCGAASSGRWD